jgi:pilus assembly protein Flp/PilA
MGSAEGHGGLSDAGGGFAACAHAARSALSALARDIGGATAIEYAIIASMLSLMIIAGATTIGQQVKTFFESMIVPFL